jgi:Peptidase family M28/PA domain
MPRWSILRFVVVFAAVAALVLSKRGDEQPRSQPRAERPMPQRREAGLEAHLRALQRIATEHGGTRAAGSPGDAATSDYIEARLRDAGYRVRRLTFSVPFYRQLAPPRLTVGGRRVREIRTLQFSPGGTAAGRVRAVGLGCGRRDFAALRPGEVALVRRGICFFRVKAENAQRAGAAAALMVNDEPGPVPGSLIRPGLRIPVLGLSGRAGEGLAGRRATVSVDAVSETRQTASVVAESGPGHADRVVMAGGHLDSVPEGPGLNDNGSGVAALLTIAERLARRSLPLRFGFWGAEEIGLVGSRRYLDGLSEAERLRIAAYVNLDMVGSPDARPEVYGSRRIEDALRRHLPPGTDDVAMEGNSDHASFQAAGISAGGLFTGLDDCYHRPCDTVRNVDRDVLAESTAAVQAALVDLSR